jgi:RNA polymerase sigma-70 factor, ECF subfamily
VNEPNDAWLVETAKAGDTESYSMLVRRHGAIVLAVCIGMLSDRSEAEDAAQDAFLRGFEKLSTLKAGKRFRPWVVQIARHRCLDLLRERKRHSDIEPESAHPGVESGEDSLALRLALDRLPEQYRVPLMLFYFDGRSSRGVAEALGISVDGACTRLSRARRELRKLMSEQTTGANDGVR